MEGAVSRRSFGGDSPRVETCHARQGSQVRVVKKGASNPDAALGWRMVGGHAGIAPCNGFLAVEGASGFSEGRYRSRGRLEEGLDRRGPLGGPSPREGRVGDERGVRRSPSGPLHRRVHADSSESGRCTRRFGVGPELRLRKRAAHRRSSVASRRGTPEQGRRCTGDPEVTETPLRVRDDRSQGVSGLRVGCKSQ